MAQLNRVKRPKLPPPGRRSQPAKGLGAKPRDALSVEEAAPDSYPIIPDGVEQALKAFAGDGGKHSMNAGARAKNMLSIQRTLGNRAARVAMERIQRAPSPAPAPAVNLPGLAQAAPETGSPEELQILRKHGPYPADAKGSPIVPSTGMGGFNARYDPISMVLTITLNIGMNFLDGMKFNGDQVVAAESSLDKSAVQINDLLSGFNAEERSEALKDIKEQWAWSGPGDGRITKWMAEYRANVTSAWSSAGTGIVFQGSRLGWETQLARVNVVVNTQNITSLAPGTNIPGPQPVHCQADIYKTPEGDTSFGASVDPGKAKKADDQRLELGSSQVSAQTHLLSKSVNFANNSSTLNSNAEDKLRRWIISFQAVPGTPGDRISITGHSNTKGEKTPAGRQINLDLSYNRALAVEKYLKETSVEGSLLRNASTRINFVAGIGAAGANEEKSWRRVDIMVGSGQGQNIAAHEFGHMIGLDDEYASTPVKDASGKILLDKNKNQTTRGLVRGSGDDVGTATETDPLSKEVGLGRSVNENNDNIMSLGSTVRPQHYATFMQALHNLTSINDWRVKP